MLKIISRYLVVSTFILTLPVLAKDQPVDIPDTPAGRQLEQLLAAFQGGGDPHASAAIVPLEDFDELDAYLRGRANHNTFSGVVLVAKEDKPIFQKAYGFASKRFNIANNVDTKFNIGSINKVFTSVSIYQLVEQGRLAVDEPIGKYLPDFPKAVAEKVTVHHLLKHESGWGAYWDNEYFLANWTELLTLDDYMVFIKDIPLDFEPGTDRQYSNTAYEVLGAIIEEVTGESYYDYVRQNIYEPAGMLHSDSYVMDSPTENLAIGYMGDAYKKENTFSHPIKGTAAGGGYSTAGDLLRFTIALHNNKLLSAEHSSRYRGMGIAGGAPGISAAVEDDVAGHTIIVLSNFDPPIAEQVAQQIGRLVRDLN